MTSEPVSDHGQMLAPPAGKVIGFVDTKANFDTFSQLLQRAGIPDAKITSLYGGDGLQLLERLKDGSFFFSDSEDSIIRVSINELKKGHYAVAVDVKNREDAIRISDMAKQRGGHGFSYFGTLVVEQLS